MSPSLYRSITRSEQLDARLTTMNSEPTSYGDSACPQTKTPLQTLIRVRNNQRRHRERRRQYIALLEQKLQDSERHLNQALGQIAVLKADLAKSQLSRHESSSEWEHESSSPAALRAGHNQSRGSEMSEGRQAPSNAEGYNDAAPLPSMSPGFSLPTILKGNRPVTEMASLQPMLVAEQQFDTNHRQQGTVLHYRAAKAALQRPSTTDEVVGTTLPMLGILMPKPFISEPPFPPSSISHYPLHDGQPTTPCVQAYVVISQLNYRGLDSDSITAWLSPGFRRASLLHEECQVESKRLFELLDFISDS